MSTCPFHPMPVSGPCYHTWGERNVSEVRRMGGLDEKSDMQTFFVFLRVNDHGEEIFLGGYLGINAAKEQKRGAWEVVSEQNPVILRSGDNLIKEIEAKTERPRISREMLT